MSLDDQTQSFLDKARTKPAPAPGEQSLEEFRAAVEPFRQLGFEREEVAHVNELSIPRAGGEDVSVRLYRPEAPAPLPVMVWAHGGSWVRVTVDLLDNHYRAMANRSGCAVAAVDYRLSPESRFPQAIEETYAAACWLKQHSRSLGLAERRIAIGGESSGGNIAAAVALTDRERRLAGFVFQALVVPVLDVRFETDSWERLGRDYLLTAGQLEWALEQYAPGVDADEPLLSPLAAGSLDGLPPALIMTGEYDPLKDEGAAYAGRLREAGVAVELVEVPGLIHHAVMAPAAIDRGAALVNETATKVGAALRRPDWERP
jgi:acetyl esterase/lipase